MKKIIILGASVYQVPLIKKAKELGFYTIVISIPGDYYGFQISDKNYFVDTRNKEEILKISRDENIDGICTSGTDVAVITIGYINETLGLNGVHYDTALSSTNKYLMKKRFVENGVNTARFFKAGNHQELIDGYNKLNCEKAVVKIVDKSGSRGIKCVDKDTDFKQVFDELMKETNVDYVIIEEFIKGIEIGVDLFMNNSEMIAYVPHNKMRETLNHIGIPSGHIAPYTPYYNEEDNILIQSRKVVEALGIKEGAVNIDAFVLENGEVYIIEAGSRAGGTGLPEVMSNYLGVDYYEMILRNALNMPLPEKVEPKGRCTASLLLFSDKDGIYSGYELDEIEDVTVSTDYRIGQRVEKITDGTSRIGQAIILADSMKELEEKINYIRNNIKIFVE